mgnify:CR=1 FL=1
MKPKMRAVGWTAYCVKLDKGTAVHKGPWRGWVQPTKALVKAEIERNKAIINYATLVPAKLLVEVPVYKAPKPRCPSCHKVR